MQRFNDLQIFKNGLVVGVARGEHGGETGDFFLATAHGARLFKLPAVTHDFERAFAVDFFLQPTQRTVHRFAFFQFNLCHYTHFLSRAGQNRTSGSRKIVTRAGENRFFARKVNVQKALNWDKNYLSIFPFCRNQLDFAGQSGKIQVMIAVETSDHEIRVNIPTDGMSAAAVRGFLDWLRVEAAARRSRLTKDAAWKLSEDIKSDWWAQNQNRFTDRK
jgi:hypothetical protein